MEFYFKVGNNLYQNEDDFLLRWRDGQLIDIRPDGYYDKCESSWMFNCVIRTPQDFWTVRGSTDWKSTIAKVFDIKKYITAAYSDEKYPWELTVNRQESKARKRDWFIDFRELLSKGIINQTTYEVIYDHKHKHPFIFYNGDLFNHLHHEDGEYKRIDANIHNQPWSAGTKTIGAAGDATDIGDAETKTAATLTGDLTWEHLDEETAVASDITWNVNTVTNSATLYITAQAGAEHDGSGYGNGARVSYGSFDDIYFDESVNDTMEDVELSKLAFDITGSGNGGIQLTDCAKGGLFKLNRCLFKGSTDTKRAIAVYYATVSRITNNIIYGCGEAGGDGGILFFLTTGTSSVLNNTLIGNYDNIVQDEAVGGGTTIIRNNLCQAYQNADFRDDGAGFGTANRNVSEDATAPGTNATINTDMHTANDVFENYDADDFKLDSAGHAGNLAILKAGEDLSGTFTDDIIGQTRSDFYIGASEIVGASPPATTPIKKRAIINMSSLLPMFLGAGILRNKDLSRRDLIKGKIL